MIEEADPGRIEGTHVAEADQRPGEPDDEHKGDQPEHEADSPQPLLQRGRAISFEGFLARDHDLHAPVRGLAFRRLVVGDRLVFPLPFDDDARRIGQSPP